MSHHLSSSKYINNNKKSLFIGNDHNELHKLIIYHHQNISITTTKKGLFIGNDHNELHKLIL